MKLHLGSSEKHIDGYINVDIRDLPGVDIIDNIITLEKFENNTADLIYSSHVLEHTGRREFMSVLKRWYDVLKPGGVLRLAVPDLEAVFKHYQENHDLLVLRGFLYGGQTYAENYHYCGWDFQTLSSELKEVGFKEVSRYDWRTTEHSHIDDFSKCHLPHDPIAIKSGIFNKHTLMSLNIEATK